MIVPLVFVLFWRGSRCSSGPTDNTWYWVMLALTGLVIIVGGATAILLAMRAAKSHKTANILPR